jgi:hypothetical protein
VAANHLLQIDCSGRRFSQAGLDGEGGKESMPATNGVIELLVGHGGEEEHSGARSSSAAEGWPYMRCFWCSGRALLLLLLVGRGGEREDRGGTAATHWRRCRNYINYLWWFHYKRKHTAGTMADVICSRRDGCYSDGCYSASETEESPCPYWFSTPSCSEVIRSRQREGCQWGWVLAGRKSSSLFSPFLGSDASRKPASGDGAAPDLIAFPFFVLGCSL